MDFVHRLADDFQRTDLHLVVDPNPARLAPVRPGWRRAARCCAAQRALGDPARYLRHLSGAAAVQRGQLRTGQAAARSPDCRIGPNTAAVRRGLKRIVMGRPWVGSAAPDRPSNAAMILPPSRRTTSTTRVRMKPNRARATAAASIDPSFVYIRLI